MSNSLIENWTNYSMRLRKTVNPDFFKIRNLSSEFVTKLPQEAQDELFSQMNRGELPLGSEPEMSMYMFAYGKMHYEKLLRAFEQIPKKFFENEIEIIDYGCGQAMGLIAYADYIKQKGYNQKITKITLIEPSKLTIGRAILHANQIFPNVTVNAICKSMDDLEDTDIQTDVNTQKLHIFSNIIDVELFSLTKLSDFIKQNFDGNNQFVCVSPFFGSSSSRANRLDEFMNLMATSGCFAEDLGKNDWINGWTCSIRVYANNSQNANVETDSDTVTDIDGNVYKTVKIGNQIWMAENLRVSRYRNGDLIPNLRDNKDWKNTKSGAWCNYDNNPDYDDNYGKLYNWYAVDDRRCLAPEGWHVAFDEEWKSLIKFLGGSSVAGGKIKEVGTLHWKSPNKGATNESFFFGLPCGFSWNNGTFGGQGDNSHWWTASNGTGITAWLRYITFEDSNIGRLHFNKKCGYSVRCVKNIESHSFIEMDNKEDKVVQKNNLSNITDNISLKDLIQTVLIPEGNFIMGSPKSEVGRDDNETQHQVTLSSFRMSKYTITNEQYAIFLNVKLIGSDGVYDAGAYPTQVLIKINELCGLTYSSSKWVPVVGFENAPVSSVTWFGASEFATYVGGLLPTEAQWEYACRALTIGPFNTGSFLSNLQANYNWTLPYFNYFNTETEMPDMPLRVGKYAPNAFGLYDMHGNVSEWCYDWYGIYPNSPQINPKGALTGSARIIRGGSWDDGANSCRSAHRDFFFPGYRTSYIGFRVVFLL